MKTKTIVAGHQKMYIDELCKIIEEAAMQASTKSGSKK